MKQPITVFVSSIFVSVQALYFKREALLALRWMGCLPEMTILDNPIGFPIESGSNRKTIEPYPCSLSTANRNEFLNELL